VVENRRLRERAAGAAARLPVGRVHSRDEHTDADAADEIRCVAPDGVDLIVDVAAAANAELDQAVLRPRTPPSRAARSVKF
jgi:NADPH2:quinone reductase